MTTSSSCVNSLQQRVRLQRSARPPSLPPRPSALATALTLPPAGDASRRPATAPRVYKAHRLGHADGLGGRGRSVVTVGSLGASHGRQYPKTEMREQVVDAVVCGAPPEEHVVDCARRSCSTVNILSQGVRQRPLIDTVGSHKPLLLRAVPGKTRSLGLILQRKRHVEQPDSGDTRKGSMHFSKPSILLLSACRAWQANHHVRLIHPPVSSTAGRGVVSG